MMSIRSKWATKWMCCSSDSKTTKGMVVLSKEKAAYRQNWNKIVARLSRAMA